MHDAAVPKSTVFVLLALLALVPAAARPADVAGDPLAGSGAVARTALRYHQLIDGVELSSPQNERDLGVPAQAAHPEHSFEGRLELFGEDTGGRYRPLRGNASAAQQRLPEIDLALVQNGSHLIPARRGLTVVGGAAWHLIVEPGRVWQENGDRGMSRASLPFALIEINQMCTHNGVLTFLFDHQTVSHVWYQITQETCAYRQGDFWGMLPAAYHRAPVPGAARLRRDYADEVAGRMPVRPLARLAEDYPGVDPGRFGLGVTPAHMTAYGVVYRGVNYQAPCRTRYGVSPYCGRMRTPSYSTAKTAFAAVALMRLAEKYGAEIGALTIADYVPEAASSPGDWRDVTFIDALDMATGHYHSALAFDDENRRLGAFGAARTYAQKIAAAFDAPRQEAPGRRWVYRSTDTFILVRAMDRLLRQLEGPGADVWELVVEEVYRPIGLSPGIFETLRTADNGWRGQPFGYMGMFWTADDIAKMSTFLNVDGGAVGGRQVLHRGLLMRALRRVPGQVGRPTGSHWGNYQLGLFAPRYTLASLPAGEQSFWAPFMSGWGGIKIVMMPNGACYYYTSDNHEYIWYAAVVEAMTALAPAGAGGGGGPGPGPGPGGCSLPAGHPHRCRDCGPCALGIGDCDRDSDCASGLVCADDVGAGYGFKPGIDVCVAPGGPGAGGCPLPAGHPHYCRDCAPCPAGAGDCDRDSDCASGLVCADDVGADYGFGPGIDVCVAPGS